MEDESQVLNRGKKRAKAADTSKTRRRTSVLSGRDFLLSESLHSLCVLGFHHKQTLNTLTCTAREVKTNSGPRKLGKRKKKRFSYRCWSGEGTEGGNLQKPTCVKNEVAKWERGIVGEEKRIKKWRGKKIVAYSYTPSRAPKAQREEGAGKK